MADVLVASATSWDGEQVRNIGDEALTAGLVDALTVRGHRVVASLNGTVPSEPGRVSLSRPGALIRAVRDADLVVLGGGTLLAGHVDGPSIVPRGHPRFLAAVSAAAAASGRPFALVGVGAERWPAGAEHLLLRAVVRHAAGVWARDPDSAALTAARTGVVPICSGDTFFGARVPDPVPLRGRGDHVLVALSGRTSTEECDHVAAWLAHGAGSGPDRGTGRGMRGPGASAPPVWIRRMDQSGDDERVSQHLASRLADWGVEARVLPPVRDWRVAYTEMASAQAVVASRLHALIFAARARTPILAVGRSAKVVTFAAQAQVPLLDPDGGWWVGPERASGHYLHGESERLDSCVDAVSALLDERSGRGVVREVRGEG